MTAPAEKYLSQLLQGIANDNVGLVRSAWRELLTNRYAAIPLVADKLRSDAWAKKPRGPGGKYLGVLLALMHELDREAFRKEVERLDGSRLHTLHRHTVNLMKDRECDKLIGTLGNHVPVYVSNQVDAPNLIWVYLKKWSLTQGLAFKTITRIDVIAAKPDIDYLGKYDLFTDGVILVWENGVSGWFKQHTRRLRTEQTFYHEVGHHYHRHSEFGQVTEQEREANEYMRLMYRRSHPVLTSAGFVLIWPLKFMLWVVRKFENAKNH